MLFFQFLNPDAGTEKDKVAMKPEMDAEATWDDFLYWINPFTYIDVIW